MFCAIAPCAIRAVKRHAHEQSFHFGSSSTVGVRAPGFAGSPRSCGRGSLARRGSACKWNVAPIFLIAEYLFHFCAPPSSAIHAAVTRGAAPPRGRTPCSARSPRAGSAERVHLGGEGLEGEAAVVAGRQKRRICATLPSRSAGVHQHPVAVAHVRRPRTLGSATPEMCTSPVSCREDRRLAGQVVVEGVVHQAEPARARRSPRSPAPPRTSAAASRSRSRAARRARSARARRGSARSALQRDPQVPLPLAVGAAAAVVGRHQHQRPGAAGRGRSRRAPSASAARAGGPVVEALQRVDREDLDARPPRPPARSPPAACRRGSRCRRGRCGSRRRSMPERAGQREERRRRAGAGAVMWLRANRGSLGMIMDALGRARAQGAAVGQITTDRRWQCKARPTRNRIIHARKVAEPMHAFSHP